MSNNIKQKGQVFTPNTIVETMLDNIGYIDDDLKYKYILEPSFGDGAFLCTIVNRILTYAKLHKLTKNESLAMLDYVYGIEIDTNLYANTIDKLNVMLSEYDLSYNWPHLYNMDALKYVNDIRFDYIVGNPPYVKIHNLDIDTRKYLSDHYQFCGGNTDLYIAFFEMCIPMLSPDGKMAFITPNSYFKNTSQKSFRQYLINQNCIEQIIDYGSYKVFDNADTYTAIAFIRNNKDNDNISYSLMKNIHDVNYSVVIKNSDLSENPWTFPSNDDLAFLTANSTLPCKMVDLCQVSHGISTNADSVYIVTPEHFHDFEVEMLRPVIKASTLKVDNKIIFPYKWNKTKKKYEVIPEHVLEKKYPKTYTYLLRNKDVLLKRDMDKGALWYQYARSQGLSHANKTKLVIKHIINTDNDVVQTCIVDKNTIVYSGIYIVTDNISLMQRAKRIIENHEFYRYAMIVGKNMANGYKSINTKTIKNYGVKKRR